MSKDEILNRLFIAYDSIGNDQNLPRGLTYLIWMLAKELDRTSECLERDEGHRYPDFGPHLEYQP